MATHMPLYTCSMTLDACCLHCYEWLCGLLFTELLIHAVNIERLDGQFESKFQPTESVNVAESCIPKLRDHLMRI